MIRTQRAIGHGDEEFAAGRASSLLKSRGGHWVFRLSIMGFINENTTRKDCYRRFPKVRRLVLFIYPIAVMKQVTYGDGFHKNRLSIARNMYMEGDKPQKKQRQMKVSEKTYHTFKVEPCMNGTRSIVGGNTWSEERSN